MVVRGAARLRTITRKHVQHPRARISALRQHAFFFLTGIELAANTAGTLNLLTKGSS